MALSLFSILLGQEDMNEKMEKARQLEADGQPEQAISIYEVVYQQDSKNKPLTFKIAGLAYQVKNYKKAIKYYEILAPNGNPTVLYNLACSCALAGKQGKAIKYLELAVDKGFNQVSLMRTDPDLISIRNHKKFESIVSSAKSIENIPEARAFDFWVGEWTVYYPNKQKVGDSKIEKILKGAVILENWTGVSGVTGKSFNHYHIDSGKWVQYWVDQASGRIHYEGNFDPDLKALVYYEVNRESNTLLKRLTFYDLAPDSVRQHSEIRSSENDPWATEYDFTYVRK
ncbi:MAG: hypothetical protein K9M49_04575 [Candidatus Marinimicrobia bacterium]|nr:hypothetical protein [Candidatus Neomarinimicrobiota bacterium]MCF7904412.1 hypothetical protein [Candidatus Neomarinimicrobiota bacterium]